MLPLLAALIGLGGCTYFEDITPPLLSESGERIPAEEGEADDDGTVTRAYPEDAERGRALDIEVIRVGNAVRLINRTTRTYENAELWLNHEYGAPIDTVETGKNEPLSLRSFVNAHGERYPLGVFLAPDLDEALVEADLIVDGTVHPLPVRLQGDWTEPKAGP
jgi:hypothetical protein